MKFNMKFCTVIVITITMLLVIISKNNYMMIKIAGIVEKAKFSNITRNMETKKYNNITYYYTSNKDETYINTVGEYLREGEEKATSIFGQTTMYPLNIIMFTTSEEFGKTFNVNPEEGQAATIFDSIYIPIDNIKSYVLVHEYIHYKMDSFCKDNGVQSYKIPSWFKEGVSEYISSTLFLEKSKDPKVQQIKDFRELDKTKEMWEYDESYMQSYIAVRKIVELKGQDSIGQILINTKAATFYNALEDIVGMSIDKLCSD